MALNYIFLTLLFVSGIILVLGSVYNARFLFGPKEHEEKTSLRSAAFNPLGSLSRKFANSLDANNKKRTAYFFMGIVILILGLVAIFFTDFLQNPIKFE
ncbi:MAG TPA: hypothetical protein VK177_00230 [Flavobacteriales bacterium]|nr:hypothetical protein [Flavobacteriales bacterium]